MRKKVIKKRAVPKNGDRKRTTSQILADREFIARLRIQGWTLDKVTAALNAERQGIYTLSSVTVFHDIQAIEKEWLESTQRDVAGWKAKELAELDRIGDEAWTEYGRSKATKRKATAEVYAGGTPGERKRSKVTTEDQTGDARYMDIILKIQERRAKLLGLNAPVTVANPDGTPLAAGAALVPVINVIIAPPPE